MKKNAVLLFALLFSASLVFAIENKPNEKLKSENLVKKPKVLVVEKQNKESVKELSKKVEVRKMTAIECFGLSCGTACMEVEDPLQADETVAIYNHLDGVLCGNWPIP